MRWLAALALTAGTASAVWPTPVPRPTATPRPAATPTPRPAATSTPRPVATATPRQVVTPTPETSIPVVREFVLMTGAVLVKPAVGQPIKFSTGGEFLVMVRFDGELVPCQLVRVAR